MWLKRSIIPILFLLILLILQMWISLPSYFESRIRSKVILALENMRSLASNLDEMSKQETPRQLGHISSKRNILIDPFTHEELHFSSGNGDWLLISSGPDKTYENAENLIPYDPSNGTLSRGDIIFGRTISPDRLLYVSSNSDRVGRKGQWISCFWGWCLSNSAASRSTATP